MALNNVISKAPCLVPALPMVSLSRVCVAFTVDVLARAQHSECRFKHHLPERMETFLIGAKVNSVLKDEAPRIFLSVPDTGRATV